MKSLTRWTTLTLVMAFANPPITGAQDTEKPREVVEQTSIVRLKPDGSDDFRARLDELKIEVIAELPKIHRLVVNIEASELTRLLDRSPGSSASVELIEPDGPVALFESGCISEPWSGSEIPPGVVRVGGPLQLSTGVTRKVWVIDTGIAVAYDQSELNVDRAKSVECNPGGCGAAPDPTKTADDTSGHGTAVAGIIGARNNGTMTAGVVPNVVLVAVQVSVKGEIKWSSLYNALEHLLNSADFASGDVINISLGATWNPNPNSIEREIEQQILNLAAVKSARIAMAAGNLDALDGTAYLPTVTPARAAIFPKPANGAVMAVSAVDANDAFWPDSGFGNGKEPNTGGVYVGPPEVAEPGVGIATLGLKPNNMAKCTGTSFAAPHLAGLLMKGLPDTSAQVSTDIDTIDPQTGQADARKKDRIGACTANCVVPP